MNTHMSNKIIIKERSQRQVLVDLDQNFRFELGRLLKNAHPNQLKIHQLTKIMQREVQYSSFDTIRSQVVAYYTCQFERRTTGQFFRTFGVMPYPWLHNQFMLSFANCTITDTTISKMASFFRHLLTTSLAPPKEIVDSAFLHLTLYKLVNPRSDQNFSSIGFSDFLFTWARTAENKWGDRFNSYFNSLADNLDFEYGSPVSNTPISMGTLSGETGNELELTQTDLEWMKGILLALKNKSEPPNYPLTRGPAHQTTRHLEKVVRLLSRIRTGPNAGLLCNTAIHLCTTHLKVYGQYE